MSFELPESLSGVSSEELSNLLDDAKNKFNELYESEDISNEALEAMEELANAIETVVSEQNRRVEAASKRAELSAKAAVIAEVVEEAAVEEAEEVTEESVEESVVEASTDLSDDEPSTEEVAVEASVEDDQESTITNPGAEEGAIVAANKPTSIAIPERGPSVMIAAAVDVPQFYVGQRLDPKTLADAIHNKARMLSDSRGMQTVYPVATIERPFGEGYDLEGLDQASTWDRITEMAAPGALTAAGGWCAPSQIVYDLFEVECESELLYTLPTFRVTRGGIRWPVFEPHDETFDPGFVWTEANDEAAATGTTPTKACVRISCPTFTECRLDAVGLCITAGNLIDRAYPEQVRWYINRAIRAYERNNAIRKLTLVLADTAAVTVPASFGAASSIVASLLLQATDYRQLHGLCYNTMLDVTAPSWVTDLVKADVARQEGVFTGEGSLPSDQMVNAWFQAAGLNLKYIDNWQEFTHPATAWPSTVDFLVTYPGSYVEFNQGRLDVGVIRDSVLNSQNDYTATWFEEFYCVGRRGPQGRIVTVPVCADGTVGGRNGTTAAFVCA